MNLLLYPSWEQRKLGEVATFSKGNGYSKSDLVDFGNPIILYGRLYTKYETIINHVDTFVLETENSVISKKNEVIVPASGESSEDISRASVVDKSGIILGGDLNIIQPFNFIDSIFLALTISNGSQKKEMAKRAQGKSIVHLHNSDLRKVNLVFPKLVEQQKIGAFFKQLDSVITQNERKIDFLKQLKQAYLQKIFSQALRFAGFSDDWKESKAKYLFIPMNERKREDLPVLSVTQDKGVIFRNDLAIDIKYDKSTLSSYKVIHPDDFIISLRSFQGGFELSKVLGISSPAYTIFNFANPAEQDKLFWKTIFKTFKFIESLKTVTFGIRDGKSISFKEFGDLKLNFPSDVHEQAHIGDYFSKIDNLITLNQQKLTLLKKQKQAYLQKMFI